MHPRRSSIALMSLLVHSIGVHCASGPHISSRHPSHTLQNVFGYQTPSSVLSSWPGDMSHGDPVNTARAGEINAMDDGPTGYELAEYVDSPSISDSGLLFDMPLSQDECSREYGLLQSATTYEDVFDGDEPALSTMTIGRDAMPQRTAAEDKHDVLNRAILPVSRNSRLFPHGISGRMTVAQMMAFVRRHTGAFSIFREDGSIDRGAFLKCSTDLRLLWSSRFRRTLYDLIKKDDFTRSGSFGFECKMSPMRLIGILNEYFKFLATPLLVNKYELVSSVLLSMMRLFVLKSRAEEADPGSVIPVAMLKCFYVSTYSPHWGPQYLYHLKNELTSGQPKRGKPPKQAKLLMVEGPQAAIPSEITPDRYMEIKSLISELKTLSSIVTPKDSDANKVMLANVTSLVGPESPTLSFIVYLKCTVIFLASNDFHRLFLSAIYNVIALAEKNEQLHGRHVDALREILNTTANVITGFTRFYPNTVKRRNRRMPRLLFRYTPSDIAQMNISSFCRIEETNEAMDTLLNEWIGSIEGDESPGNAELKYTLYSTLQAVKELNRYLCVIVFAVLGDMKNFVKYCSDLGAPFRYLTFLTFEPARIKLYFDTLGWTQFYTIQAMVGKNKLRAIKKKPQDVSSTLWLQTMFQTF